MTLLSCYSIRYHCACNSCDAKPDHISPCLASFEVKDAHHTSLKSPSLVCKSVLRQWSHGWQVFKSNLLQGSHVIGSTADDAHVQSLARCSTCVMTMDCGCWQVEGLAEVERAFVHVDYALRAEPEHKVSRLAAVVTSRCARSSAHCVLPTASSATSA